MLALGACGGDTAGTTPGPSGVAGAPPGGTAGATSPAAAGAGAAGRAASPSSGAAGARAMLPTTTPATGGAGTSAPATAGSAAQAAAGGAAPAATGGTGGGAAMPMAGAEAAPPAIATEPVLPPVMGECPDFQAGRIMVAGHRSIQISAGDSGKNGPLLFYWHGTGSSAAESAGFAGNDEIISMGGIIAAFNGSGSSGRDMDCSGTAAHNSADFEAADQIVACGVMNHGIDPKRIYTTGCSAGGLQSGCMGIMRSGYLAATAPNSGGVTIGYGPIQDKSRMPAVMTMHGSPGVDVVIVDFSNTSEGYDNYMLENGSFVINCNHGGGHCGVPTALSQSAWQFMKDHPFGARPSPYANGLPSGFHDSCKIFTMTDVRPIGDRMGGGQTPTMPAP